MRHRHRGRVRATSSATTAAPPSAARRGFASNAGSARPRPIAASASRASRSAGPPTLRATTAAPPSVSPRACARRVGSARPSPSAANAGRAWRRTISRARPGTRGCGPPGSRAATPRRRASRTPAPGAPDRRAPRGGAVPGTRQGAARAGELDALVPAHAATVAERGRSAHWGRQSRSRIPGRAPNGHGGASIRHGLRGGEVCPRRRSFPSS